jgi:hypothetical protein
VGCVCRADDRAEGSLDGAEAFNRPLLTKPSITRSLGLEVVSVFVEFEVAVPDLRPA